MNLTDFLQLSGSVDRGIAAMEQNAPYFLENVRDSILDFIQEQWGEKAREDYEGTFIELYPSTVRPVRFPPKDSKEIEAPREKRLEVFLSYEFASLRCRYEILSNEEEATFQKYLGETFPGVSFYIVSDSDFSRYESSDE